MNTIKCECCRKQTLYPTTGPDGLDYCPSCLVALHPKLFQNPKSFEADPDPSTWESKPVPPKQQTALDYDKPRELTVRERIFIASLHSKNWSSLGELEIINWSMAMTDRAIELLKERQS